MSNAELIEYAMTMANVVQQIDELSEKLSSMEKRLVQAESDSSIAANTNKLLLGRIASLENRAIACERAELSNAQYLRRRQLEISSVPLDISQENMTEAVCKVLSLTGEATTPADIDVCHRLQNKSSVIMEFRDRSKRNAIIRGRKRLKDMNDELSNLGFKKSFILESMSKEHRRLDYICRSLKKCRELHETWFYNGRLFVIIEDGGDRELIGHIDDLYSLFGRERVDGLLKY